MTQDKDEIVPITPTDMPFMDKVSGIVSGPINWTLDPLAKPPRYESGWTEIITKGTAK